MHLLLVVLGALGVIGAFFFEMLAEGVFQVAGWATGWVVVPMLTLGRVVVEPRKRGVGAKPKWLGIDRAADGTLIVGAELGSAIGIVFWFVVVGVVFLIRHR